MKSRLFLYGMVFSFLLMGCTGFSFYHHYGLANVDYSHGTLLGPQEKDDLPFVACAPNAQSKHPCVVLFADEFFKMKQDYEDTANKLKECEKK